MGGVLKVVVRFGNGEVVAQVRNTNPLPSWIRNARLIRGDEAVMRAYVEMGRGHGGDDRTYAPVDYGCLVVDHATRTILSANAYSDCQTALLQERDNVARQFGTRVDAAGAAFADLLGAGFLHVVRMEPGERFSWRRDDGTYGVLSDDPARRLDLTGVTPGNWDERVFAPYSPFGPAMWDLPPAERRARPTWFVAIEHVGWNFEQHDDGLDGQAKVRGRLRDLGFSLTPGCERAYADWRRARADHGEGVAAEAAGA